MLPMEALFYLNMFLHWKWQNVSRKATFAYCVSCSFACICNLGSIILMKRDDAYCICCTGLAYHIHVCHGSFILLQIVSLHEKWQDVSWKLLRITLAHCLFIYSLLYALVVDWWMVQSLLQPCPCLIDGHGDCIWWDMHHGDLGPGFFVNGHYSTAAWYLSTKIMQHVQLHLHKQRF